MVAKAGLGLIGLSAISIGGVAVTKPHWLGMDYMPVWKALSEDANHGSDYSGETKFGKKYGKYLVSATNKENKSWWEWAFRRIKEANPPATGKFKHTKGNDTNVNESYDDKSSGANTKALNQVCKSAFSQEDTTTNFGTENTKFNKSDIWKYCSPLGQEPTTVKNVENKSGTGKLAKYTDTNIWGKSKEDKLVSIEDPQNKVFWEIKDKEFKSATESANYFAKYKKDKNIKEICSGAYDKQTTDTTGNEKVEETTLLKYCSFEQTT